MSSTCDQCLKHAVRLLAELSVRMGHQMSIDQANRIISLMDDPVVKSLHFQQPMGAREFPQTKEHA